MNRLDLEIEDNKMHTGDALVSLPNNLNGSAKVKRNDLTDVKVGVLVRDEEQGLEQILLQHLKDDTPPEKLKEIISTIQTLQHKTPDTVTESLFLSQVKQYLKVGKDVVDLGIAIVKLYAATV